MQARWVSGVVVIVVALGSAACGESGSGPATSAVASTPVSAAVSSADTASAPLKITSWGPQGTKAGTAFNVQPDGSAAIWIHVNRSLDGYEAAVDFNGTLLKGNISGNLVTTAVPAALYAKQGTYTVRVIAREGTTSVRSDDVRFAVQ